MEGAHVILSTTPSVMDAHPTGSVKDVSRCTSFTFTRRSPKEELKTRTSSWPELPAIVKKNIPLMRRQALKLELNHELSTDNSTVFTRSNCCHSGALALLEQANKSPLEFLSRHFRGDWGDLCQDDKTENELSLKHLPQPAYPRRCP